MGCKVVCERGRVDVTVQKRMSAPLDAHFGVCVCVCVKVCARVPGSLRVRECVVDTSLFMPGVSLRMKAVDVRDFGLIHCDNVIICFCQITLERAECLFVYCETLTVICMCVFGVICSA